MEENIGRTELGKKLSDICRNTGKISFKITYTSTEGNGSIDKEFQEFCYKYSNNEYLAGIGILLKSFKYYEQLEAISEHLGMIDGRLFLIEEKIGENPESKKVADVEEDKNSTF